MSESDPLMGWLQVIYITLY